MTDEEPDGYDLLPEKKLLVGLLPYVGGPIATYLQERRDRQVHRAAEFQQAALDGAGLEPAEFIERIADDERLSDLFWTAMDSATRTSLERKRLGLGRILANAVSDDTKVDEAELFLRALNEVEVAELRLIEVVDDWASSAALRFQAPQGRGPGVEVEDIYECMNEFDNTLDPLIERLKRLNIFWDDLVSSEPGGSKHRSVGVTAFGKRLLQWIRGAEDA